MIEDKGEILDYINVKKTHLGYLMRKLTYISYMMRGGAIKSKFISFMAAQTVRESGK